MVRLTIAQKVDAIPDRTKEKIDHLISTGSSITDIAEELGLDYKVVQEYLWQVGTLPWRGAKRYIAIRLRKLPRTGRQPDRQKLCDEITGQVQYLYFAARKASSELNDVKRSLSRLQKQIRPR